MHIKNLTTIGRVIFALPLLVFALFHFMNATAMAGIVPNYFPGPGNIWVYLAGLILALGGLGILLNKKVKESGYAIAVLMLIFIVTLHLPGMGSGETAQMSMVNLLKDTIILGGALMVAAGCSCDCKKCTNCEVPQNTKPTV